MSVPPPTAHETTKVIAFPAKETGAEVVVGFAVGLAAGDCVNVGEDIGLDVGVRVEVALGAHANKDTRTRQSKLDSTHSFLSFIATVTPPKVTTELFQNLRSDYITPPRSRQLVLTFF